jgi:hypothetical protein
VKNFQSKLFLVFLTSVVLLSACGKSETANQKTNVANQDANTNSNTNLTKDDAEEFAKIVNLPVTPEEIAWRETNSSNTKKLIAVLKFSPQDTQTILAQIEKHKAAAPAEIDAEDWFPPELIAKSQESGDEILHGNAYAANDFYSESYKNGKITRIGDTSYFVLELTNP